MQLGLYVVQEPGISSFSHVRPVLSLKWFVRFMIVVLLYRNVWKFLQKVAKDAYNMTDFISRNLETTVQLLKKCPDKWLAILITVLLMSSESESSYSS